MLDYSRYENLKKSDKELLQENFKKAQGDKFYPSFHIAPPFGLLNDPNGLIEINGKHHIFFQWHPKKAKHDLKYWYYVTTCDFLNFNDHKIGLEPSNQYDLHGCYSGGAYKIDNENILFYTGNYRDKNQKDKRVSTQLTAILDEKTNEIKKTDFVLQDHEYTEHYRDPKIFCNKDQLYLTVGAQDHDLNGCLAIYKWNEKINKIGTLYLEENIGFMWECPDLFNLNDKVVLLFSPQGVKATKYDLQNYYNVVYVLADDIDLDNSKLVNEQKYFELDKGFDFYAPQTYIDGNGKQILIAWLGDVESSYITDYNNWAHMLSIPREITIENNYLIQKPYEKLEVLEDKVVNFTNNISLDSSTFKLEFDTSDDFELRIGNENKYVSLKMSGDEFILRRDNTDYIPTHKYYEDEELSVRHIKRIDQEQNIIIYVDNSAIEIFINGGKNTITSRFFINDIKGIYFKKSISCKLTYLKSINLYSNYYDIDKLI